jgi:death-on-curing protein
MLSRNVVLALHDAALAANGGLAGVRDEALLDSALAQPAMSFGGVALYPTLIEKAAALGFSLIANHPFVDGNKRVGWSAMLVALELNGVSVMLDEDEEVNAALAIAAGTMSRGELVAWLRARVIYEP